MKETVTKLNNWIKLITQVGIALIALSLVAEIVFGPAEIVFGPAEIVFGLGRNPFGPAEI